MDFALDGNLQGMTSPCREALLSFCGNGAFPRPAKGPGSSA